MINIVKKIFGDKHSKDFKLLWPVVEEINEEYEKIRNLTDDQLKEKTGELKEKIQNHVAETKQKIDEIRERLHSDEDFDRQASYDELDEFEEELDDKYEEILDEILPEAFAVVKSTCERLLGKTWTAAGSKITWNMVPYEVQLMCSLWVV